MPASRRLLGSAGGGSYAAPKSPLDVWLSAWSTAVTTPVGISTIGTSITSGTGASPLSNRWTDRLEAAFDAALGAGAVTVNTKGIGSATSGTYAGDHSNIVLGSPTASLVIIELGVNDMSLSVAPATFKTNMLDIIAYIRGQIAEDPSFLLVADYELGDSYPTPWQDYVDKMDEIAAAAIDCLVLDMRPYFGEPSTTYLDPDLVHPNNAGHQLFADAVYQTIVPA